MTHVEFITSLTHRVRLAGAAATLDQLRAERAVIVTPNGTIEHHDTLAVFYVWAVDRLLAAGLNDIRVLWHPLVDVRSPRSWWDDATLESDQARDHFVPSTLAHSGEPTPVEYRSLSAA
jgi:hypothetical protein